MMIVSLTRGDLRDEFAMANEAFALSPITARAVQPSEEDYDAISQAFMETSRGRWFLGEYAKRNRNADTRMVLDAVARIEEAIVAQRQPAPESGLAEALTAIRGAVDQAQTAAATAVESLALEENLAPIRRGVRVIREISWRWREIGADGRICDLLDSQVGAIEGACGQISSADPQAALSAAFDLIKERIAEFDEDDAAARAAEEAAEDSVASPSSAASDDVPVVVIEVETVQAVSSTDHAETAMSMPAEAVVETAEVTAEVADVTAEAADVAAEFADATAETAEMAVEALNVTSEVTDLTAEAADAHDEAVLDLVALEMAAPQPADIDDPSDTGAGTGEVHVAELAPADSIIAEPRPEPPAPRPAVQPSLGSMLIASGIVRRPHASPADPLAPIRRMSQAERIALFS
jgi:hypothetical protein